LHALQLADDLQVAKDLILQQPVAKLPWGHCCVLLDKLDSADERRFYAEKAVENGWSRNTLTIHIQSRFYSRHGRLQNNFNNILPAEQSDLLRELFKDPYKFDFLNLSQEVHERDIEKAMTDHILKFLLEMGRHFAFVGRQVHLKVGESDFYVDVLLYHTRIHAYIALELKYGEFKPDYVGKMGLYLSAIDSDYKTETDAPSIGIILCTSKDKVVVEYALRNSNKPVGVSEYTITKNIPKELKSELPYIERLKEELVRDIELSKKAMDEKLAGFKVIAEKDFDQ
jgi:predicted nuclease of restriction endonuclease-like (RecB) superfamily